MQLIREDFFMIVAALLLALPMLTPISVELFAINNMVLWGIFWFYLFKSYSADRRWMMLFTLPVLLYNPIFPLNLASEIWGILNGFFFVLAVSWLLKSWRDKASERVGD